MQGYQGLREGESRAGDFASCMGSRVGGIASVSACRPKPRPVWSPSSGCLAGCEDGVGRSRKPAQNHLVFAGITLAPLPGYSPELLPVEALWRWLREDVTCYHCHATADDLTRRVAAFEVQVNQDPCAVADRLWVQDQLDPHEEKLRSSN